MFENNMKFEIKINPLDCYEGLREKMQEFENSIDNLKPRTDGLAQKIEKHLKSRFCQCCFFGHVTGEIMGEALCDECARELYGITETKDQNNFLGVRLGKRAFDLHYQLWYRKQKAMPIFEAYLHAELERWKAEEKLAEYMQGKGKKE